MNDKIIVPVRIQRKRTKGWRMPPNTVYVGRPSKWGNQFNKILFQKDQKARDIYEHFLDKDMIRRELKGKNLACWCSLDEICHADILLKIANER